MSDYQKGRWPGDAAQRQRNPARAPRCKKGQELIMHSPAYAIYAPRRPAAGHQNKRIGAKNRDAAGKEFFWPGAQLAARFGPLNGKRGAGE